MHSYWAFIHMNSFFMNLMNFINSFIVQNAWETQFKMICIWSDTRSKIFEHGLIRSKNWLRTRWDLVMKVNLYYARSLSSKRV